MDDAVNRNTAILERVTTKQFKQEFSESYEKYGMEVDLNERGLIEVFNICHEDDMAVQDHNALSRALVKTLNLVAEPIRAAVVNGIQLINKDKTINFTSIRKTIAKSSNFAVAVVTLLGCVLSITDTYSLACLLYTSPSPRDRG